MMWKSRARRPMGGPGGLAPRPGFGAGSPAMPAYGEASVRAGAHAAGKAPHVRRSHYVRA